MVDNKYNEMGPKYVPKIIIIITIYLQFIYKIQKNLL